MSIYEQSHKHVRDIVINYYPENLRFTNPLTLQSEEVTPAFRPSRPDHLSVFVVPPTVTWRYLCTYTETSRVSIVCMALRSGHELF